MMSRSAVPTFCLERTDLVTEYSIVVHLSHLQVDPVPFLA